MKKIILILFLFFINESIACISVEQSISTAEHQNIVAVIYFDEVSMLDDKEGIESNFSIAPNYLLYEDSIVFFEAFKQINEKEVKKYNITSFPTILVIDGSGFELFRFLGGKNQNIRNEMYQLIDVCKTNKRELINYKIKKTFNTSIRVAQKYFDYLAVNNSNVNNILRITDKYIIQAEKKTVSKSNFNESQKQKINLIKLFKLGYTKQFEKLKAEINFIDENIVFEENKNYFYFLKYLYCKALKTEDLYQLEGRVKLIEDFEYYISKVNLIINKQDLVIN